MVIVEAMSVREVDRKSSRRTRRDLDDEEEYNPTPAKRQSRSTAQLDSTDTSISRKRKHASEEDDQAPAKRRSVASAASETDDGDLEYSQVEADPQLKQIVDRPAECGIIEKVALKNFMCHSNLDVVLGPNATILNGKNGSGKSAILVAIVVGLGGAASATKRGQSLKNFVKEGCSAATITIKIKNRGDGAYNPEDYGDTVIVERRISIDGTGSYKIKNSTEKVMANTKDDLIRILDHFNIQVDNPVCVLQQDMSRSFMHSTSPKDKYKFFMQATQLDLMCRNYREILEYKEELAQQMKLKKDSMPGLQRDVTIKEQRFKDLERLDKLEQRKAQLECDMAWAQIKDLESILEETRAQVKDKEKRLPQYTKKLADCDTAIQKANQERDRLSADLEKIRREVQAATNANKEKDAQLRQRKHALQVAQAKKQQVKGKIRATEADRNQVITHIDETRQIATRDIEAESRQREAKLQRLRHELREVDDRLRTSSDFRQQLEHALRNHQEQKYNLKGDMTAAEQQVEQQQRRLEQLRSSVQNRVQVFGRGYADLVRKIDQAHQQRKFRQKPIGPVGLHVKLQDDKWALAVEACVSRGILSGFLIDNGEDKRLVQQLIRETRLDRPPTLILTKFQFNNYDVSRNKPNIPHPTVMDVLDIDNPVVFNALIDQRSIESHVLIHNADEARRFIWSRPQPAKCSSVYTGDGDVAYPDKRYISNRSKNVMCLQRNIQGEIEHVERDAQASKAALKQLTEERKRIDVQINDTNKELRNCRGKLSRDQDRQNRLQADVQELANFEEEAPPDIATLEEDVRNFDLKLEELRNDLQELEEQESEILPLLRQQQAEQEDVTRQNDSIASRGEKLKEVVNKADHDCVRAKQHREHYQRGMEGKVKEIDQLRERVTEQEADLKRKEGLILQAYPERSASRRSVKNLESELKQTERALREKERNQGNREEITAEYHEVSVRFKRLDADLKILDKLGDKLGKAMMSRQEQYKYIRAKLETRLKVYFLMFMSKRGYQGHFEFNHGGEILEMHVKVVDDAKLTKDTKTLSGGERSFAMVAFILALWDVMETPFRCLDEFDVFMDLVNRRIAMEMLLNAANTNRKRQFILLTPQDLSDWSNKDHVRILRMKDPVRNQPTLDSHLVPK